MKNWIIVLIIAISGCTPHPAPIPETASRNSYLILHTWHLISTTILDEQGGVKSHYRGLPADSIVFDWEGISDSIAHAAVIKASLNNQQYSIPYHFFNVNNDLSYIKCLTPWKDNLNYSDTLVTDSISYDLLVFRVRYSDSNGKGIEIDSLKK